MQFKDRKEAGAVLAQRLAHFRHRADVIVLALPRGGVPVAAEVARALNAPLDILVVRKLGVPGWEELAMGAIASGGVRVMNDDVLAALGPAVRERTADVIAAEEQELRSREERYRGRRPFPDLHARCVILIDDGLATGATMRAAARAVRQLGAARIVVAVPVGAPSTCDELQMEADEVICAVTPPLFFGVGQFYSDFRQTSDDEVRQLLDQARPSPGLSSH